MSFILNRHLQRYFYEWFSVVGEEEVIVRDSVADGIVGADDVDEGGEERAGRLAQWVLILKSNKQTESKQKALNGAKTASPRLLRRVLTPADAQPTETTKGDRDERHKDHYSERKVSLSYQIGRM